MKALGNVRFTASIRPGVHGVGTINGATIDRYNPSAAGDGFRRAVFIFAAGTAGAGASVAVKVQDSDDGSTWTDIPGAAFAPITPSNHNSNYVLDLDLLGRKRYLRAVATVATAASACAVMCALYATAHGVAQEQTPVVVHAVGAQY
ncbi:MAG: hypothetical protein M3380_18470 [Chloroflexota bacterium]|jgi:hypothetical protein|nr:hypothetical protein [Chloroflexota bacterium]